MHNTLTGTILHPDETYPFLRLVTLSVCVCGLALGGCKNNSSADGSTQHSVAKKSNESRSAKPVADGVQHTTKMHDSTHPPIDCPLRKQGINPAHLRPFEDVEKYISFLERVDRASWQKPDEVVAALGLKGAETLFDLGAGSGYFSFRFAEALPAGKVIAADTEPEMIRHIHHRAVNDGIPNVEAKLITPTDPGVTADTDFVFVCDVLHHVADRPAWLTKLTRQMKTGAHLALVEFKEGKLPEGPPEAVKIPRGKLVELVEKAGLLLEVEHKDLLPYQVFLVFKKP